MNTIQELIHRRRRQILLHSILYYSYNTNIIPDTTFDQWAQELAILQQTHPEDSQSVDYHLEAFKGYTGETGFHLPLHDKNATKVARQFRSQTSVS